MTGQSELQFLSGGRVVLSVSLDAFLGRKSFQNVHPDAIFLSDPQIRVFKSSNGAWSVEHITSAVNETILEGKPLRGIALIENGAIIGVGNSSKGILKFPLKCVVDEAHDRTGHATNAEPGIPIQVGPYRSSRWNNFLNNARAQIRAANWSRVGLSIATVLGTVLRLFGVLLGAVFTGMLRGASSGISSQTQVHRGNSTFGEVILTIDGSRVIAGNSTYGAVILTIDGNQIRRGNSMYGDVMATVEGESVREGNSIFGNTFATINGNTIHEGSSMFGTAIATIGVGGRMAGAAAAVFLLRM